MTVRLCARCRLTTAACTCGSIAAKFDAVQTENRRLWEENLRLRGVVALMRWARDTWSESAVRIARSRTR